MIVAIVGVVVVVVVVAIATASNEQPDYVEVPSPGRRSSRRCLASWQSERANANSTRMAGLAALLNVGMCTLQGDGGVRQMRIATNSVAVVVHGRSWPHGCNKRLVFEVFVFAWFGMVWSV